MNKNKTMNEVISVMKTFIILAIGAYTINRAIDYHVDEKLKHRCDILEKPTPR